jgi:hypothetical protein
MSDDDAPSITTEDDEEEEEDMLQDEEDGGWCTYMHLLSCCLGTTLVVPTLTRVSDIIAEP